MTEVVDPKRPPPFKSFSVFLTGDQENNMTHVIPAIWVALILALGPIAGILGGRKLRTQMPPRKVIYASNAANLVLLAAITGIIDFTHGRVALAALTSSVPLGTIAIWSAGLSMACIGISAAVLALRIRFHLPPKATVLAILPGSSGEKLAFVFVCLLTGVVEEFIYRGFVLLRLREWMGSAPGAVILVSASFALMHGIQDRIAMSAAFVQGVLLGVSLLVVGSLAPSMIAHVAVDLFAGFCMLTMLRRFSKDDSGQDTGL